MVKAIERDRAEIDVAPLPLRVGTAIASVAPSGRRSCSASSARTQMAAGVTDAQRDKR